MVSKSRNYKVGDVVLLKTDEPRNEWPMVMVERVYPDETGLVRSVKIRVSGHGSFKRPISKLILIKEVELNYNDSPPEEPKNQDLGRKS